MCCILKTDTHHHFNHPLPLLSSCTFHEIYNLSYSLYDLFGHASWYKNSCLGVMKFSILVHSSKVIITRHSVCLISAQEQRRRFLKQEAHGSHRSPETSNTFVQKYDYIVDLERRKPIISFFKWSFFVKDALCQFWLKLTQLFWRRSFFLISFMHFCYFVIISPQKKVALHLNKLQSPSPKDFSKYECKNSQVGPKNTNKQTKQRILYAKFA